MIVTALQADCFKNLDKVTIEPHPKYNLITGLNAQGKTNLLESIWLMTGCRSFRGSKDKDYIGIGKELMEIGMRFDDGRRIQTVSYRMSRENIRQKDIKLNGVPMKGTKGLFNKFKAIVFTPDDIDFINGSPEKRRSFVDLCCCQLNSGCLDIVRRYELIINQRNNLLKLVSSGKQEREYLEVWDRQAAVTGTLLSKKRQSYVNKLSKTCAELYSLISGGKEQLSIEYNSNIFGNNIIAGDDDGAAEIKYAEKLNSALDDDIRLGYTLYGAHRDDLLIKINGMSVKDYGSQGQKKTAALVLKLGQAEIYYKNRSEAPVILLDDVMGELDENRQRLVFEMIRDMQVFVTSCNENAVTASFSDGLVFNVSGGHVERSKEKNISSSGK